jgi:hypothetical protein
LHLVPMRVAVSSVVANGAYSPFDLVDGDLATAWNARTGEAKPWIAFRVPPSTHVERVRMTVGFTATGPEGEYFTMNPRINKVRVWQDKVSLREVTLDPESRALQDVPIDALGGDYRIEIVETVPGSRKDWREVCVSELQVIGQPPPGMKPHDDLAVLVGSLDGKPVEDDVIMLSTLKTYRSVSEFCTQWLAKKEEPCGSFETNCRTQPEKATCGEPPQGPPALPSSWPPGWKNARWIGSTSAVREDDACHLAIETATGEVAIVDNVGDHCGQPGNLVRADTRFEAADHGGWFVLVTANAAHTYHGDLVVENLRVCASDHDGKPACTDPIWIGSLDHSEGGYGPPGADGLGAQDDVSWRLRYKLVGDVLILGPDAGKLDANAAKLIGRYKLRLETDL